jgi:hypothetical protein
MPFFKTPFFQTANWAILTITIEQLAKMAILPYFSQSMVAEL